MTMGESKTCPSCRMTFRLAVRLEQHIKDCKVGFAPVKVARRDEG